jgi:hypothetical protein
MTTQISIVHCPSSVALDFSWCLPTDSFATQSARGQAIFHRAHQGYVTLDTVEAEPIRWGRSAITEDMLLKAGLSWDVGAAADRASK